MRLKLIRNDLRRVFRKPWEHKDEWKRYDLWEIYIKNRLPDEMLDEFDNIDPELKSYLYSIFG